MDFILFFFLPNLVSFNMPAVIFENKIECLRFFMKIVLLKKKIDIKNEKKTSK